MPVILLSTFIKAPAERVFDLSRSITLHTVSMQHTGEKAIAGVTSGLIHLNESVTWQARHFYKTRLLETMITGMDPYRFFADEMVEGDFKMMRHEHHFSVENDGTLMKDKFRFEAPYGVFGAFIGHLLLRPYLHRLLIKRNLIIKEFAETNKWKDIL